MVGAQSKSVKEKGRVEKMTLAELLKFARVCEDVAAYSKVEKIKVKQENLANALSTEQVRSSAKYVKYRASRIRTDRKLQQVRHRGIAANNAVMIYHIGNLHGQQ